MGAIATADTTATIALAGTKAGMIGMADTTPMIGMVVTQAGMIATDGSVSASWPAAIAIVMIVTDMRGTTATGSGATGNPLVTEAV
jgi:hypothetical protein